ncbi:lytic transglycosylase [Azoarcus sp. DD4]|uniref:transglycosylase SLT domain-containing protein n=1 Tax=Azoarcus sp. DD4 TaxID=2027405 RepID=UPI00112BC1CF|nr:transglycosylase SLT domain-containing protein [Azoarcus sp. DD4]QDF99024.1 lytic transglycosylase [Azoarcus sp. DD4]
MRPLAQIRRRFFLLAAALTAGVSLAWAGDAPPADDAPAWSDEPPVLARLLESGYRAERTRLPELAVARYCAAARAGSIEGQYRLGRLYLTGRGVTREAAVAAALLGSAARNGHEQAAALLGSDRLAAVERLPDCMLDTRDVALAETDEAVPHEVVDRYVQALPGDKRRNAMLVQKLAPRFAVDPRLALAIVRTESNFDAAAVSPKNAQGLMQLIPETAERFGVRNALDPEQNVRGGLAYLRWLLKQYEGDVALASAAYNAGEGAVARFGGVPPYAETQEYVRRVLAFYRSSRHRLPGADLAVAELAGRG